MNAPTFKVAALVVAMSAVSGGAGYWAAKSQDSATADMTQTVPPPVPAAPAKGKPRVLYWYDPMVPNQHFDKPGKSPFMDMQLVPQYANDEGGADAGNSVRIDPAIAQNLGMRTAPVTRGTMNDSIEVAAKVQLNEREAAVVQARSAGFVERVYARAAGDVVARGAALADLLIPDWAGAQQEWLAVLKTGDGALVQAVRERLRALGMPGGLIAEVEKTGQARPVVTVTAPIGGAVQSMDARIGMAVAAGDTLARINGLDTVWVEADVPEAQAGAISLGRNIPVELTAYTGETFNGKVIALLPEADASSRTVRVRIVLPNRDGRIRPGMFARAHLAAGNDKPVLLVPGEAVIHSGTRDVVMVALGKGGYRPVEVRLGRESGGRVAVLEGLEEGQQVVVSGQFLIDSEASLKGVMARGAADAPAQAEAMSHDRSAMGH